MILPGPPNQLLQCVFHILAPGGHCAVSIYVDRAPYRRDARRSRGAARHERYKPFFGGAYSFLGQPPLGSAYRGLNQNYRPKPGVLKCQLLHSVHLMNLQAPVILPPSVIRHFGRSKSGAPDRQSMFPTKPAHQSGAASPRSPPACVVLQVQTTTN